MQPTYDSDARALVLAFDAADEIEPFVESMQEQNGFLAAVPERLPRGAPVTAKLTAPGGLEGRLEESRVLAFGSSGGRALHRTRGGSTRPGRRRVSDF